MKRIAIALILIILCHVTQAAFSAEPKMDVKVLFSNIKKAESDINNMSFTFLSSVDKALVTSGLSPKQRKESYWIKDHAKVMFVDSSGFNSTPSYRVIEKLGERFIGQFAGGVLGSPAVFRFYLTQEKFDELPIQQNIVKEIEEYIRKLTPNTVDWIESPVARYVLTFGVPENRRVSYEILESNWMVIKKVEYEDGEVLNSMEWLDFIFNQEGINDNWFELSPRMGNRSIDLTGDSPNEPIEKLILKPSIGCTMKYCGASGNPGTSSCKPCNRCFHNPSSWSEENEARWEVISLRGDPLPQCKIQNDCGQCPQKMEVKGFGTTALNGTRFFYAIEWKMLP